MMTNENLCPFCKSDNHCMAHSDTLCWCSDVMVPEGLVALVPADQKRKACICLECIEEYQKDSHLFQLKYL